MEGNKINLPEIPEDDAWSEDTRMCPPCREEREDDEERAGMFCLRPGKKKKNRFFCDLKHTLLVMPILKIFYVR